MHLRFVRSGCSLATAALLALTLEKLTRWPHNTDELRRMGRIEVGILYDRRQLQLRVRDNGKGIEPKVLAEGELVGHYGLAGMHERAKRVMGKLAVLSRDDSGTDVELTIIASVAYAKLPLARRLMSSGKGT